LEFLLDFLTELYECAVVRKARNEWTLGDLLPAIDGKLCKVLKVETPDPATPGVFVTKELKPILDELKRIAQTRNKLGAHFSKLAFDTVSEADGRKFATHVLELADLLVHPQHGLPRNDKSGSYWACAEEKIRLHPLKRPK
jgi:hypothetical protein